MMYRKILVPLDGSRLAECVLHYVEALARGCDMRIKPDASHSDAY